MFIDKIEEQKHRGNRIQVAMVYFHRLKATKFPCFLSQLLLLIIINNG